MTLRTWMNGWPRRACVIGFSIAVGLLPGAALAVTTIMVNTTDDGVDISPGDGNCSTVALPALPICTLRAAVTESNRMPNGGAEIILPPGTYNLTISASIADGEENGDLNLIVAFGYAPGPTTITGSGAATTIIDAHGNDRILHIDATRSVTITGVSFVNGSLAGSGTKLGGGIYNQGSIALTDCIVSHNAVGYGNGGGVFNEGYLAALRVTFNDNTAQSYGGGIYNSISSQLVLSQCTVSANKAIDGAGIYNASDYYPYSQVDLTEITCNTATGSGGGVANAYSASRLSITRSTVSNNAAAGGRGGGVYNNGILYAGNSTISANSSKTDGGGFYNSATGNSHFYNSTIAYNQSDSNADNIGVGPGIFNAVGAAFYLRNSVVAANTYPGPYSLTLYQDCSGALTAFGKNRFYTLTGCSVTQADGGSTTVPVPLAALGALQDNGGPTRTIALLPVAGANLIDFASNCVDENGTLNTDQRGRPRPVGASCDVGAFEYDPGDIFINGFQ